MKPPIYCTSPDRIRPTAVAAPRAEFRFRASTSTTKAARRRVAPPSDEQLSAPWLVGIAVLVLFSAYLTLTFYNQPTPTISVSYAPSREEVIRERNVQGFRRYLMEQTHHNQIGQKIDKTSHCLYLLYPNGLSLNHDENNEPDCNHATR